MIRHLRAGVSCGITSVFHHATQEASYDCSNIIHSICQIGNSSTIGHADEFHGETQFEKKVPIRAKKNPSNQNNEINLFCHVL